MAREQFFVVLHQGLGRGRTCYRGKSNFTSVGWINSIEPGARTSPYMVGCVFGSTPRSASVL
jgi:hypothetical protein